MAHGNPVTRLTIRRLLEQQGHAVAEARDHDSALACLATPTTTARPTIVIVDSDLLGTGSVDLVRSIETEPEYGAVRIVIVTDDAEPGHGVREPDDGPVLVRYLSRPYSRETLLAALHPERG